MAAKQPEQKCEKEPTSPPPNANATGIVIPTSQTKADAEDQKERDKTWIRKYGFTPDQLAELKESFALFDKSGEEMIASGEFGLVLRAMGQNPTEAECLEMVHEVDLNDHGKVSLDEFMRVVGTRGIKSEPEMEEELEEALRVFDKDGMGYLEADELKNVLKTLGEKLEDDDVAELVKTADVDKEGRINYLDFVRKIVCK